MIESKKLEPNDIAQRDGFTLIELLVVIAIIAILAAILLPVLRTAQQRAQQTQSLNNIKQWAAAQDMYVDDNNQYLPFTKVPDGTPGTPGGYDEDTPNWSDLGDVYHTAKGGNSQAAAAINGVWFDALPNYIGGLPLYDYFTTIDNGMSIFNASQTIFHCPSALINPNELNDNIRVVFDYGMNSKGIYGDYGNTTVGNETNISLRATFIKHPSAFVLFSDNRVNSQDIPSWDTQNTTTLGSPQCYTSRVSMRHDQGANLGFSDGHAAHLKYDYIVVDAGGKPSDPGLPDVNWSYDGTSVDGIGAP
jgi:prepilin-type N-terminal cleavage/methylation domain-containing protein/prepilin-type processing-associated H-X9-DG protein